MRKMSILIASKDDNYNEALAASFLDVDKTLTVYAVSFENLEQEGPDVFKQYDAILVEDILEGYEDIIGNIALLSEKRVGVEDDIRKSVYKYQSAENILKYLSENCSRDNLRSSGKEDKGLTSGNCGKETAAVSVISAGVSESCKRLGLMLAKAFAFSGRRTVIFDLREFQEDRGMIPVREGKRSWDDLLYCCVYGRNRDVLERPEDFAAVEESGLLFFKSSEGINPFCELSEEERKLFFCEIKEKLNADLYILIMNNIEEVQSKNYIQNCDVTVIAENGCEYERKAVHRLKTAIQQNEGTGRKILTVCSGSKWKENIDCDFSVFFSEDIITARIDEFIRSKTWKDIMCIADYIQKIML